MLAFMRQTYSLVNPEDLAQVDHGRSFQRKGRSVTVEKLEAAIRNQAFTVLIGERDACLKMVLGSEWKSRMRPGWRVQLQLDDQKLQDCKLKFESRKPSLRTIRLAQTAAADTYGYSSDEDSISSNSSTKDYVKKLADRPRVARGDTVQA